MLSIVRCRSFAYSAVKLLGQNTKFYSKDTTIRDEEVDFFRKLANEWWDENGAMGGLHILNGIRVPMIRDGLLNHLRVPLDKRMSTARPLEGLKIIDVGCGAGIYSEALARVGADVTGLDATKELIGVARSHAKLDPSLSGNLRYVNSTVEEYSEEFANHFDAVVCSEVIEHVDNKKLFVEKCVKMTKKNGLLFYTTINKTWLAGLFAIGILENVTKTIPKGTHHYDLLLKPSDLEEMLKSNGCDILMNQGILLRPGRKWMLTNFKIWYAMQAVKVS